MSTAAPDWAVAKAGRPLKYPLRTMELYEVFTIQAEGAPQEYSLKNMLYARGKDFGRKFVYRKLEDGSFEVCRMA
jgi:hypothetical protein